MPGVVAGVLSRRQHAVVARQFALRAQPRRDPPDARVRPNPWKWSKSTQLSSTCQSASVPINGLLAFN
jgi:hypothetical protein